jgi:quinol monooxygenase YgiN
MKYTLLISICILIFSSESFSQNNLNMKNTTYSTEIIRYKISEDQRDNFMRAYGEAAKHLQASAFCLGYDLIQGEEEPANFIVVIYWTSKDDHLNGFRKSAEFAAFFNLVKPFYHSIEEMKHYNSKLNWAKP